MDDVRSVAMDEARLQTGARTGQMIERFEDLDRRLRALVEERPLATVLGAVVVGYVLARISSRL
jgi:hypothetical protein